MITEAHVMGVFFCSIAETHFGGDAKWARCLKNLSRW
jgi:hypothetical protein